eukprot:1138972-Amphidinium_carterae.1
METDDEPQVNNAEGNAAAQSISSGSLVVSSMDGQTMVSIESMMWDSVVSPQCSPLGRQQIQEGELTQDFQKNGTRILKAFASIARSAPIIRDTFHPPAATDNLNIHLWFTWLTEA